MSTARTSAYLRPAIAVLALLAILLLLPLVLALQWQPTVARSVAVDSIAINAIEELIVDNAPASVGRPGELGLHLDREELNLLTAFALQTIPRMEGIAARVDIQQNLALLDLSIALQLPLRPLYLNVHAELLAVSGSAVPGTLWIGRLPVPGPAMRVLLALAEQWIASSYVNYDALRQLKDSIRTISIDDEALEVTLHWEPQLLARVQNQAEQLLLSADDSERIDHYSERLVQIIALVPDTSRSVSLSDLLTPLFQLAQQSVAGGADPIAENRSLLQALARYVNDSAGNEASAARRLAITIQRRPDLAQHFTSSAAMTASVGADIAGVLATSKEAHDARYRSGFSFSDLTANMAGVAFGNAATSSPASARQLQARLAQTSAETDYMPQVARDNAGLSENDFLQQFQDRTSPAYLERLAAIQEQLAALPVYAER